MGNLKLKMKRGGGSMKNYAAGGMVEGPLHEQGGVVAQTPDGQPIAEVEGGERIFSIEDTQAIEQAAMGIIQASEQAPEQADQMAMQLGYQVTDMVVRQEQMAGQEAQAQPPQGVQPPGAQPPQPLPPGPPEMGQENSSPFI